MANTVLKTKSCALSVRARPDPRVLESCKELVEIDPLSPYSRRQQCQVLDWSLHDATAKVLQALARVMPDTGVRWCPPSSTAPTLSVRASPLSSWPPHLSVNFMLLPAWWDKLMLCRGDWLRVLFSCGCTVPWPGAVLHLCVSQTAHGC